MSFSLILLLIHLPLFYSYDEYNIEEHINYLLYTRDNILHETLRVDNNGSSINGSSFDSSRKTKIIIHGYLDNARTSTIWTSVRTELLYHGDYNVIIVDWFRISINFYPEVVRDAEVMGKKVANFIKYLMEYGGANFEDFHLIGHSLGAQISGFVGNHISNLGRITGLDPAGPLFQNVPKHKHLDKTDANFVDVIHTDIAHDVLVGFGTPEVVGHADFFPNGGNNQAYCGILRLFQQISLRNIIRHTFCDHLRALSYFIQSINKCSFVATKCSDWKSFTRGKCGDCRQKGNCALMGYKLHPEQIDLTKEQNIFYLKTSDYSPYCSNQYQIKLILAQPKNATINVSGMYLHLIGSKGELYTALIRRFSTLRGDIAHKYLVTSELNLGNVEKVTFLWVNDSHSYLQQRRKGRRRKKRLYLKEIHVLPLQLSNNKKKRFCGVKKRPISSNSEREFQEC